MDPADSILVRRSQAGDLDAYRELVRRHAPAVRAMALSHVHETTAAAALTLRVFQGAWKLLFTLRDVSWFPLFILRQAHEAAVAEGKERQPAATDRVAVALAQLAPVFREMLLLDAALGWPGAPLLMEYTGLGQDTVTGRQARGLGALQHHAALDAAQARSELRARAGFEAAAVQAFAEQVITAIRSDPRFKPRPAWLSRLPPLPLPLALGLALALAAVLVGMILRMMPAPAAATQPAATHKAR